MGQRVPRASLSRAYFHSRVPAWWGTTAVTVDTRSREGSAEAARLGGAGAPGGESWLLPRCVTLGTRADLSECGVAIASSVKAGMLPSSWQEAPGLWCSNVSILWADPWGVMQSWSGPRASRGEPEMDPSHVLLKPEAQVAQGASCPWSLGLKVVPGPPSLDGDTEVLRGDLNLSRAVQLQTSVSVISEAKPVCCAGGADRDLPRGMAPCPLSTRHPGGAVCLELHLEQSSTCKGPLLAHPFSDYSNPG